MDPTFSRFVMEVEPKATGCSSNEYPGPYQMCSMDGIHWEAIIFNENAYQELRKRKFQTLEEVYEFLETEEENYGGTVKRQRLEEEKDESSSDDSSSDESSSDDSTSDGSSSDESSSDDSTSDESSSDDSTSDESSSDDSSSDESSSDESSSDETSSVEPPSNENSSESSCDINYEVMRDYLFDEIMKKERRLVIQRWAEKRREYVYAYTSFAQLKQDIITLQRIYHGLGRS